MKHYYTGDSDFLNNIVMNNQTDNKVVPFQEMVAVQPKMIFGGSSPGNYH